MFTQMNQQNLLILAHRCITAVGISTTVLHKQTTEPPRIVRMKCFIVNTLVQITYVLCLFACWLQYKKDDSDGSATRGDWWQGMVIL
jgi:hypothetical protein